MWWSVKHDAWCYKVLAGTVMVEIRIPRFRTWNGSFMLCNTEKYKEKEKQQYSTSK